MQVLQETKQCLTSVVKANSGVSTFSTIRKSRGQISVRVTRVDGNIILISRKDILYILILFYRDLGDCRSGA